MIFLSYGRGDDEPFVARLHAWLCAGGVPAWFDRSDMPSRSLTFLQEIRDAIHGSARLVIVLGPHATASEYVRAEWQYALADEKIVVPVLRMGDFDLVPSELKNLHCEDCRENKDEDVVFARVLELVSEPEPVRGPLYGGVPSPPPCFQPRPDDTTNLAATVLEELDKPVVLPPQKRVTLLYGMGGAGKSVIAAAFARSPSTRRAFPDGVCWTSLRQDTSGVEVLRQVASLVPGSGAIQVHDEAGGASALRTLLAGKRLLLVLDNVWEMDPLTAILAALDPNTRVLVTARDRSLALGTGARQLELGTVSEETALRHLADWASVQVDSLPPLARELARECGYLPFALALNGAMLRDGNTWEDLLAALRGARLDYAEQVFASYPQYANVARSIEVSIEALARQDAVAAARFRDLAVFLSEPTIPEAAVQGFWLSHGMRDALDVRKLLQILDRKTLVRLEGEPSNRRVWLHDLVRDHIRVTANEPGLNRALLDSYLSQCGGDWLAGPRDRYFHPYLIRHLLADGDSAGAEELMKCETATGSNGWYEASEGAGHRTAFAEDLERMADLDGDTDRLWRQLRYGAMLVSINSMAANLPTDMRTAFLRTQAWTGEQAIADATRIPTAERRAWAIAGLLPYLDERDRNAAIDAGLEAARSLPPAHSSRAGSLVRIAEHADGTRRDALIDEAIDSATLSSSPTDRASSLASVLHLVTVDKRAAFLQQAISSWSHAVDSAEVDQGGLKDPASALGEFAGGRIGELFAIARRIPSGFERAAAFASLIPHAPPQQRETLAREGLLIEGEVAGNTVWIHLALQSHLPGVTWRSLYEYALREDSRQLEYVLASLSGSMTLEEAEQCAEEFQAAAFENESDRVNAMIALLPKLPQPRRHALVADCLVRIQEFPYERSRKLAYSSLAPFLEVEDLTTARAALAPVGDHNAIAEALVCLLPRLTGEDRAAVVEYVLNRVDRSQHLDVLVQAAAATPDRDRARLLGAAVEAAKQGATVGDAIWFDDAGLHGNLMQKTLADLAHMTEGPDQVAIINRALRSVFDVPWASGRADGFGLLIDLLRPDIIREGIRALFSAATHDPVNRTNQTIAGTIPGSATAIPDTLRSIAGHIPADLLPTALALAQGVPDPGWRMAALVYLTPALDTSTQRAVLAEAFETQRSLPVHIQLGHASYWAPLLALARQLSGDERQEVLSRSAQAARSLDRSWRARALCEVALLLEGAEREAVTREALRTASAWEIPPIAQTLPEAESLPLLHNALLESVRYSGKHAQPIAMALARCPEPSRRAAWTALYPHLAIHSRKDFVATAVRLEPLLESMGLQTPSAGLSRILLDVARWWS